MTKSNLGDLQATIDKLGLTISAVFVPFSQSRNKGEKSPSLNWLVTVKKDGRDILTTDYSAGCGHCPAYKAKGLGSQYSVMRHNAIQYECEHGKGATLAFPQKPGPILPDTIDVLHSLAMDSDVLDAGGFESWAGDLDYDVDSRKAEAIYRACLDIALKLRAALGDAGLMELRTAFQDY